jgi:hypothetical protein
MGDVSSAALVDMIGERFSSMSGFRFGPEYAAPALVVLDHLSRGVIFVGRDRRAHYANRASSRILSNGDGLSLDRTGAWRTCRSSDQTALDRPGKNFPEKAARVVAPARRVRLKAVIRA